jgi:carbamoyl-phosphate synthase large subunit
LPRETLFEAKRLGYSDPQLANLYLGDINTKTILKARAYRKKLGIAPVYKLVDTCAAEFEAATPYYYSTYETGNGDQASTASALPADDEIRVSPREKIVILGGGPNRIGQGIEFDYCCVQAAFAAREMGFESVMINSNPETVSTDYDTSDLLFFEPLTLEDTLNVMERLNGGGIDVPERSGGVMGVVVQFGGQTPLNLAHGLTTAGVPLIGTGLDSIDLAEDRDRFKALLNELGFKQPASGIAYSLDQAVKIASDIGYPVLVRPSYVLGGRGMETCFDEEALRRYMRTAVDVSELANAPVLIDKFLSEAIEVDVDVVADFEPQQATASRQINNRSPKAQALICGVMEHIEEAGVQAVIHRAQSRRSRCRVPWLFPSSIRPARLRSD